MGGLSSWRLMEKWPALAPPSSPANTAGESARGWHIQFTEASAVTSATERWSLSRLWRSMGRACSPISQARRRSASRASTWATTRGLSSRAWARLGPDPTLSPKSGPVSRAKASSSVTSSPV